MLSPLGRAENSAYHVRCLLLRAAACHSWLKVVAAQVLSFLRFACHCHGVAAASGWTIAATGIDSDCLNAAAVVVVVDSALCSTISVHSSPGGVAAVDVGVDAADIADSTDFVDWAAGIQGA